MQSLLALIRELSQPLEPIPTEVSAKWIPLEGIRAVLFDVYGTLMLSGVGDISHSCAADRKRSLTEVLKHVGVNLHPNCQDPSAAFRTVIESFHKRSREQGIQYPEVEIREVWETFLKQNADETSLPLNVEGWLDQLALHYELIVNPTWPMPDLDPVCMDLKMRGIQQGIISNAQFFTPMLFEAYLGKELKDMGFDADFCQWSYLLGEAKPSTRMYRLVAAKLEAKSGIQPHQVLYVGNDMLNDITPASQVGFRTALFAGDQRSLRLRENDERVQGHAPDLVIHQLKALLDCL